MCFKKAFRRNCLKFNEIFISLLQPKGIIQTMCVGQGGGAWFLELKWLFLIHGLLSNLFWGGGSMGFKLVIELNIDQVECYEMVR